MKNLNKKYHEPRYNRHLKFWLITGTVLITLVTLGFHGYAISQKVTAEKEVISKQLIAKADEASTSKAQNDTLKDKLARSATYQTPASVKAVSNYYIDKYFGKDAEIVKQVMTCESGLDNRRDHTNKDKSLDMGLYQIHDEPAHRNNMQKMFGVSLEVGAHDFDISSRYAKFLWDRSPNNWVCYGIINK